MKAQARVVPMGLGKKRQSWEALHRSMARVTTGQMWDVRCRGSQRRRACMVAGMEVIFGLGPK
jgi:hypothetical protein